MAGTNDVRKNLNLFVDGKGMAGELEEFTAPGLALLTEEWRGGGMDAAIDLNMGLEKLAASFSLISYSAHALALFGVAEGQTVPFIVRELLESHSGTKTGVVHTMRGKVLKIDPGTSKPGTMAPLKFELSLVYYKMEHGGKTIQEIDVVNMVHIVNGVDVKAQDRAILGM